MTNPQAQENMKLYRSLEDVPEKYLSQITGGRLAGFTDISRQGRVEMLTEAFGPCGLGWGYRIDKTEFVPVAQTGELVCVVSGVLWYRYDDGVSPAREVGEVPFVGAKVMLARESGGMYLNDDAPKGAIADGIGKAASFIGLGGAIYRGDRDSDDGKYHTSRAQPTSGPDTVPFESYGDGGSRDDPPRCWCGLPAKLWTSKDGNIRRYYCSKPRDDESKCNFQERAR